MKAIPVYRNEQVQCPYCGESAQLVTGEVLYPQLPQLRSHSFWVCYPCEAHVGTHPNSHRPLGTLAKKPLRAARKEAHNAFDPLWKRTPISRSTAYAWLAEVLGIEPKDCHIGQMDISQCRRIVSLMRRAKVTGVLIGTKSHYF